MAPTKGPPSTSAPATTSPSLLFTTSTTSAGPLAAEEGVDQAGDQPGDDRPDGPLDVVALRPLGPLSWLHIWNKIGWENGVLRKTKAGRKIIDLSADVRDVTYITGKSLRMTVESPQEFQLDGDPFGEAKSVHAWVDPGALTVRVPAAG